MKIKVIEIVCNGESFYLNGRPSIFNDETLVKNPLEATNYLIEPPKNSFSRVNLEYDPDVTIASVISGLRLKDDAWFAKSGYPCDAVYTVEFEISLVETERKIGRLPHTQP